MLSRNALALRIAPAVEAAGVFGYGEGEYRVKAGSAFSPAVNLFVLLGARFAIHPEIAVCLDLGGGFAVLSFRLQANHEDVSGLDGGLLSLAAGVEFGS